VIKRNQFAAVGALLLALVLGVVVLAIVALRRPATVIMAPAETAATNTPAASAPPSPSAAASAAESSPATGAASAPPTTTTPTPPPLEIAPPALVLPAVPIPSRAAARPAPAPAATAEPAAPAAPARAGVLTTPFRFDARAVVVDGDKRRERDATVLVADGTVTVTDKDKNGTALYTIPIDSVIGMTYSNSRQPLWNSPSGPAEAMKVEAGAFGFLKGGRNWFGLQTKDSLLVLRVDDEAVRRVTAGLQERTGLTLQRLAEPKD
jgi:hypothetical protein